MVQEIVSSCRDLFWGGTLSQGRRIELGVILRRTAIITLLFTHGGCAVIDSLRHPRHPQAPQVVSRLVGPDTTLAAEAVTEVKALGPGAMPELRDRMVGADADARIQIIRVATEIRKPPAVLIEILSAGSVDANSRVRLAVALYSTSAKEIEAELLPILQPLMRDDSSEVRATALLTLSSFSAPNAIPARELVTRTQDTDIRVAATACSLAIASKDPVVRDAATQSLSRLVGALQEPQPATRAAVLYALGQYGPNAVTAGQPVTRLMYREKVPEVKLQAAVALLRFQSPQFTKVALPVLRQFAKSENAALRDTASAALRTYSPK